MANVAMSNAEEQTRLDPTQRDLAQIALQEQALQFSQFHEEDAWRLGSCLREFGVTRGLKIVIDVRRFGQPLFYSALHGTTPDNVEWVRRKSNVTFRLHRSSYAVGLETAAKNSTLLARYALPDSDYASHGGCVPIRVVGAGVVAAVTVSGLPQRADHELSVEGLCAVLGLEYAGLKLA
jgi:uncharacterized protein (UPF0303 family)